MCPHSSWERYVVAPRSRRRPLRAHRLEVAPSRARARPQRAGIVVLMSVRKLDAYLQTLQPESREVVNSILKSNIGTQLSQVPFIEQARACRGTRPGAAARAPAPPLRRKRR